MKSKGFMFYEEYAEIVFSIKNDRIRAQVLEAVIQYELYGRDPTFEDDTDASDTCFTAIKKKIDIAHSKRLHRSQAASKRESVKTIKNNNHESYANLGNTTVVEDKSTARIRRNMSAIAAAPVFKRNIISVHLKLWLASVVN